ncbi:MAG: dienelactone hydrolase family protein [Legionella sp.]|nr:dienelactone hydrolase family protein [Legionella sp.]
MDSSNYIYHHGELELHGFLAYGENHDKPLPAVIVAHDWTGRNEFACQKAQMFSQMGYLGFALDMFGQARLGNTTDEKMALIHPLVNDRALLRDRVYSAFDALVAMEEVDSNRIAIVGFCFGGMCALDLARSGADLKAAITFHGLLNPPEQPQSEDIKAKILVLHGYDDPLVKPEQVTAFCREMDAAQVDWQVHMFGQVEHAFTNPNAHDENAGLVFNALASERSWGMMTQFLTEIVK